MASPALPTLVDYNLTAFLGAFADSVRTLRMV